MENLVKVKPGLFFKKDTSERGMRDTVYEKDYAIITTYPLLLHPEITNNNKSLDEKERYNISNLKLNGTNTGQLRIFLLFENCKQMQEFSRSIDTINNKWKLLSFEKVCWEKTNLFENRYVDNDSLKSWKYLTINSSKNILKFEVKTKYFKEFKNYLLNICQSNRLGLWKTYHYRVAWKDIPVFNGKSYDCNIIID